MTNASDRIVDPLLASRVATAEEAAEHIDPGDTVGISGFTGAGYPKAVPTALAARIEAARRDGGRFRIQAWSGASTAPDLDGVLAAVHGISKRIPYQSDPTLRRQINDGEVEYVDVHLSHAAQHTWFGFYGPLDVAVVEVAHVDHTEHDVQILITEQGLADLRGLSPRARARRVIDHCAHPDFRDRLRDYVERAERTHPDARHTPHLLDEALSWHTAYLEKGHM
jgi:acyl-CoA hydrolase